MCGIAGYTGRLYDGALERMAHALFHRGPDADGFYHAPAVHLAHRRLSVVDLTCGTQPMHTADGRLTVVFNGEIYNQQELRLQLTACGHHFQTDHSDTEVLLHGWREWGQQLPEKLNGMWAFCLYDRSGQTLFLSRDRFGKKPLYYTLQAKTSSDEESTGCFAFASELSALRQHPALRFDLDQTALRKYFAYAFIPAPRTIFQNVQKLPAAHNLLFSLSDHRLTISRYWEYRIEPFEKLPAHPDEEWGERLRELLDRAVQRRLMADVPLGVLLSGGVDSSAIAALAARHTPELKTFSIGFNEDSFDESPYARRVSTLIHSRHYETRLSQEEARLHASDILSRLDEPMADDSLLPTWLVCREARKEVTVVLGGDGGDELFAGYEPFKFWPWGRRFDIYLPSLVQKGISLGVAAVANQFGASHDYMPLPMKLKRFFRASGYGMRVWIPALMAPLSLADIAELLGAPCPLDEVYSEAIEAWDECASPHPADRLTQYYVRLYLQNEILAKGDRASMLNSLELRSPFLDLEVADFARQIPANYRHRHGVGKYILKKALEPLLPHDILYRKKHGFSAPAGRWFRDEGLVFSTHAPKIGNRSFFAHALEEHKNAHDDQTRYLWAQYALDAFLSNDLASHV